ERLPRRCVDRGRRPYAHRRRLQRRRRGPRPGPPRTRPPPCARPGSRGVGGVRYRARGGAHRRRRPRGPGCPRRRGVADRWVGARQADEGRAARLPAGAGAHRPPGGRLAGDLVAGRRGRRPPDRRPGADHRGDGPAASARGRRAGPARAPL
ncbi:MAG: Two-component transcriptional response regulator, LuxR family, partial [uncultured Frankineae bacterium]